MKATLSAFKKLFYRECPGTGQQAHQGYMEIVDDGHTGQCPECGRKRPCDMYSMMLPHKRRL